MTMPAERTRALRTAYEFFRIGLMNADNLTAEQRRQKPYVLQHFPESHEINSWARRMHGRPSKSQDSNSG